MRCSSWIAGTVLKSLSKQNTEKKTLFNPSLPFYKIVIFVIIQKKN